MMTTATQKLEQRDVSFTEFKILEFLHFQRSGIFASSHWITSHSNDYEKKVSDALISLVSRSWVKTKMVGKRSLDHGDPEYEKSVLVMGYGKTTKGEQVLSEVYHNEDLLFRFMSRRLRRDGIMSCNIPGMDNEAQKTLDTVNAKLRLLKKR